MGSANASAERTLQLCLNVPQEVLLVWAHEDVAHAKLPLRTCQPHKRLFAQLCHMLSMHFMG